MKALEFKPTYSRSSLDTSFRMIQMYDVATDNWLLRFDLKLNKQQYAEAVEACDAKPPVPGTSMREQDDLVTPGKGVQHCINIKSSHRELIRMFRTLADELEAEAGMRDGTVVIKKENFAA